MNFVKIWSFELFILDKMTLVEHMQILVGNGNSPRLGLDAYHAPLIPIAQASVGNVTWADEDL